MDITVPFKNNTIKEINRVKKYLKLEKMGDNDFYYSKL